MLKFSMWDRALEWLYRSDPWSHSLNNFIVEESSNLFAPSRVENIYCVAVVKIVSYNNNILSPPVAENYIFFRPKLGLYLRHHSSDLHNKNKNNKEQNIAQL